MHNRKSRQQLPGDGLGNIAHDGPDAGLAALREATRAYTARREELLEERSAKAELAILLRSAESSVLALRDETARLEDERDGLRARVDALQAQQARDQRRAADLLASIQAMHRALFAGDTPTHILRASMDVSHAERGYYVAELPEGLRVRAAVDVPASSGDVPSPFITGIARRVLESGDAVRWTADDPPPALEPAADEQFRRGVAVPVRMRGGPCGVIIALDKDGEFRDDEVRSLLSVGTEAGVAVENDRLRDELQRAYVATIGLLADSVQAKDPYTKGHCEQVSRYAQRAAEALGLTAEEQRVACYAALLHDVGKIGVSDGVLNKPGPLIAEERKLVEAHVRIGHDLLNSVPALREVASAVLYHHEWFDGSGYPEGLAGSAIPVASRIVAVVDAYCAMLDKRSYKEAYAPERARAELRRCAGTQFDPALVEVVLAAIAEIDALGTADGDAGHSGCGILPRAEPVPLEGTG